MAQLFTSRGAVILIDDADLPMVSAHVWCVDSHGYATTGMLDGTVRRKVYLHRFLMGLHRGDRMLVDHANMDRLDNRRANLRACSKAENMRNRGKTRANKSGFKGVSWDKEKRKWVAGIKVDGRRKVLGRFTDPEEAHKSYRAAAEQAHGAFARTEVV